MLKLFIYNEQKNYLTLHLKVKAAAKKNSIEQSIVINDRAYLRLNIKAQAKDGKANEEIIRFLSQSWSIKTHNLIIIKGFNSPLKVLCVKNTDASYLNFILNNYI